MNSQKEFEEWYVLEVSGCNGEYVEKLASGEYYDRDTNKAWQVWQAVNESCASEITALKAECEYDQRNAAQSQRETLKVLKENEVLKARLAELANVEPIAYSFLDADGDVCTVGKRVYDPSIHVNAYPLFTRVVLADYQLVPVEPTLDMLKAAYDHRESDEYTGIESTYKVMLQAAKAEVK